MLSVCAKFEKVRREHRLSFLISKLRLDSPNIPAKELQKKRLQFDKMKDRRFRIWTIHENASCYVCNGRAKIRHHVIPLVKGGHNSHDNIVPLCNQCHSKVHPHMAKEVAKEQCKKDSKELGIPFELLWSEAESECPKVKQKVTPYIEGKTKGKKADKPLLDKLLKLAKSKPILCKPKQGIKVIPPVRNEV